MIGVLDTNDNFALASALAALDQAQIIYDVVPIADVPENLKATNPKWWVRPQRILVSAEDETEARILVECFRVPAERSEVGTDLDRDELLGVDTTESRRLITFSRAALVVGVPFGATLVVSALDAQPVIIRSTIACFLASLVAVGMGLIVDAFRT